LVRGSLRARDPRFVVLDADPTAWLGRLLPKGNKSLSPL
jgi:hypothetical protein